MGIWIHGMDGLTRSVKNTERRTTLRIQRESELLGSTLQSYHTRENLVVGAKFLRDDLPFFMELLAEVATMTKYRRQYRVRRIYIRGHWTNNALQATS